MDQDGGWSIVAGAGAFAGFLDAVAVVAGAFDFAWAGPVSAGAQSFPGDLGVNLGYGVYPVLRGKCPPFRWRYGG